MTSRLKKSNFSFTLIEIMILIGLIVIVATATLILLNPKKQIEKGWDGRRKNELNQLRKTLEDWYNDKNCYPPPNNLCYDTPTLLADQTYTCHICGHHNDSPSLSPYLNKLPCDPQYPSKNYLYQVDSLSCPTYYRIYTRLSRTDDPVSKEVGCRFFCGPINEVSNYNYLISSPNTQAEGNENRELYYCQTINNCTAIIQDRPNQVKICQPSFGDPNCGNTNCPEISVCNYYPL